MNFRQMATMVSEMVDDTFSDAQYKAWFQACQNMEIVRTSFLPTEATLTRTGDTFEFPDDFKELLSIKNEDNLGTYEVFDKRIYVDSSNTLTEITIRYDRYPEDIDNAEDFVPDIPKQFHELYVYYAAMVSQFNDDETQRMSDAGSLFTRGLATFDKAMQRDKKKYTRASTAWTVVR